MQKYSVIDRTDFFGTPDAYLTKTGEGDSIYRVSYAGQVKIFTCPVAAHTFYAECVNVARQFNGFNPTVEA